jgi:hypothetical protein
MKASKNGAAQPDPLAATPTEFFAEVLTAVAAGWCPIDDAAGWIASAVLNEDSIHRRLEALGLLDQFDACASGIRLRFELTVAGQLTRMYRPQDIEDAYAL